MLYKSEAVYNQADFIGFMKVFTNKDERLKAMGKVSRISAKASGSILLIAAAINLFLSLRGGYFSVKTGLIQLFMAAVGLFLLRLPVDELSGKRAWRQYEGQGALIGFEFYNDYYVELRQGNRRRRNYGDIKALYEDDGRFYLFISDNSADIVCKRGFAQIEDGEDNGFRAFISEKTRLKPEGCQQEE